MVTLQTQVHSPYLTSVLLAIPGYVSGHVEVLSICSDGSVQAAAGAVPDVDVAGPRDVAFKYVQFVVGHVDSICKRCCQLVELW